MESILSRDYNAWKPEVRPKYLVQNRKGIKLKTIARFKFWMEDKEGMCRICEVREETAKHVLTDCSESKIADLRSTMITPELGEGLGWMMRLNERRKEKKRSMERK